MGAIALEALQIDVLPTDLREQYEVRLEEGLDAFVVIDGLPIVPEDSKQKLVKFLLRKLNTVGKTKEESIFMPLNEEKMSEGWDVSISWWVRKFQLMPA